MYRIIKDGANIGLTENLNYIKQAENGCYVLCPEHDASGIVFAGTVYHLLGRDTLDGAETVSLEETDAGTEITKSNEAGGTRSTIRPAKSAAIKAIFTSV